MARDLNSTLIRPWAADGARIDPEAADPPIVRKSGWTLAYSQVGGQPPRRAVWNQILREITGFFHDLNKGGSIPEWSVGAEYNHPAFVGMMRNCGSRFIPTQS